MADDLAAALFGDDDFTETAQPAPVASEDVQPTLRDEDRAESQSASARRYGDEDDVLADLADGDDDAPKKSRLKKKKKKMAEDEGSSEAPAERRPTVRIFPCDYLTLFYALLVPANFSTIIFLDRF
jgi:hypothetical protein